MEAEKAKFLSGMPVPFCKTVLLYLSVCRSEENYHQFEHNFRIAIAATFSSTDGVADEEHLLSLYPRLFLK